MRHSFIFRLLLCIGLFAPAAQAQVPAEVSDVMNKCRAAMSNPAGVEYEMDMKGGMGPLSMKMHFVVANKGNLKRTLLTTKIMGIEVKTETGFDGTDTWEIDYSSGHDTITFTPGDVNVKKSGEDALNLDLDHQYRKASMKLKDGYYEIVFSDPVDKSVEMKKVTVTISAKNYVMRELRGGARGAKVNMTVTKIHVGLKDSHFKLNLADYPNAVVIRNK